jgi:glutamyl-Q tRNA(Asp) synthetase
VTYIGRFAPSPSGPLHLGSLVAALGSALDAQHHGGIWLLRMEDLDPQRSKPEYEATILAQLSAHALTPRQGAMLRQSQRRETYRFALNHLQQQGLIFACDCPRKLRLTQTEACCERDCRRTPKDPAISALRVDLSRLDRLTISDRSLGDIIFDPQRHRDIIVWRRDDVAAYHLAVVVDDAAQGVTDVVRGADLAESVPWQIALQSLLGLPRPRYLHLPVLTDAEGLKLAKSHHSAPLSNEEAAESLRRALNWLHQEDPPQGLTPKEIVTWSAQRWQPQRFEGVASVPIQ